MYAIISDGGRQYMVAEGEVIDIDYREAETGSELVFDRVLALSKDDTFTLGQPVVAGAKVLATVKESVKGDKIYIQKFRRRKNVRRRTGHRQKYLRVEITKIAG
ncbi:MAG TPA: 50S ribosomal protein L21 [Pirellulaceae bacterium]|nr:50S ribosomal protein L21 [Pirellulaceae bacterium]